MSSVLNTRLVCTVHRTLRVNIFVSQLKFSFCVWTRLTSVEGLKSHFWKSYMQSKTSISSIKEESWQRVCVLARLCFHYCMCLLCFQSFELFHPIAVLHLQKDQMAWFYVLGKLSIDFHLRSCHLQIRTPRVGFFLHY